MLRIRNKSFGSFFGSGFGLKLVSDPDLISDPDLDQKLAKFFFVLKFLGSLIFKAALHQLCDLATNKVRKKLAIYEDLTHICILSVHSVPLPCWCTQSTYISRCLEYHSVYPLVGIGTPHPLSRSECVSPLNQRRGEHTRLRVRGWGSLNSDDWRKSLALCLHFSGAQPSRLHKHIHSIQLRVNVKYV